MKKETFFSAQALLNLAEQLVGDFGGLDNLNQYWHAHSRREITDKFKTEYNCSYYYVKKIFNNIFNFSNRSKEESDILRTQHINETNLQRYGRTNVGQFSSPELTRALLQKYAVDNIAKLPETTEKKRTTCQLRYGVDTNFQSPEFRRQAAQKYLFDNIRFDSSWELALYIYAIDHNEPIIREPQTFSFSYLNKIHYYTPDFLYKGQLIEIKGSQFIKNNQLVNPFDANKNELYQIKQQCIINNNVKLLVYTDIKFALDYVKTTYGKNYLQQFKGIS